MNKCKKCGADIRIDRQFCSKACWYSFKTLPLTEKVCEYCGSKFQTKVLKLHDAKYCSRSCATAARNKVVINNSPERNHKIKLTITKLRAEQGGWPGMGKHEKSILDRQAQIDGCEIVRQYFVDGFFVDGYCPETNTVYEVYEKKHLRASSIAADRDRQEKIQRALNCNFKIVWDVEEC